MGALYEIVFVKAHLSPPTPTYRPTATNIISAKRQYLPRLRFTERCVFVCYSDVPRNCNFVKMSRMNMMMMMKSIRYLLIRKSIMHMTNIIHNTTPTSLSLLLILKKCHLIIIFKTLLLTLLSSTASTPPCPVSIINPNKILFDL
jgi:hypothetical protein